MFEKKLTFYLHPPFQFLIYRSSFYDQIFYSNCFFSLFHCTKTYRFRKSSFFRKHALCACRNFSGNNPQQSLIQVPAIKFDVNNKLHEKYLAEFFDIDGDELNFHIIPSVRGFKEFVLSGYRYALFPKIEIQTELQTKQLISIYEDNVFPVPLYWHNWTIQSKFYRTLNHNIIKYVTNRLEKSS